MAAAAPDQVVDFWFAQGQEDKWFEKDPAFDAEVRRRLAALHEAAAAGGLAQWQVSARGALALCLLLDQVPRNLFRDDPRAYASDEAARAVVRRAIEQGLDQALTKVQRHFFYLPFEHSESLADQDLSVALIARIGGPPDWLEYARQHREIVARFGRFPHRNAVLGRPSTPEEIAFLKEPGASF